MNELHIALQRRSIDGRAENLPDVDPLFTPISEPRKHEERDRKRRESNRQ